MKKVNHDWTYGDKIVIGFDNGVKLLKKYNIEFTEVFSDDYDIPSLLTEESVYSYKGIKQIKDYCKYVYKV
jgi:hypothetical protein